jgi:hypothetical protein
MPRHARPSDAPRPPHRVALFAAFRFFLYGVLGIFLEVFFYTALRIGRETPILKWFFAFEWQVDGDLGLGHIREVPLKVLFGQSSLWMIPVYAFPAFTIELVYTRWLHRWPRLARAVVYGLVIMAWELATGAALKELTGYAIWKYSDPLNVLGWTTFAILPIWMLAGMLIELIFRELMDPRVRAVIQKELDALEPPPPIRPS